MKNVPALLAGFVAFVLLATANGAGYRYGVSDQAAYVPAVIRAENPSAFPRDAVLIDTQGQFFVLDEVLAAQGWDILGSKPDEFAVVLKSELDRWSTVVKGAKIKEN